EVVFRKRLPDLRLAVVKRFRVPSVPDDEIANREYRGYHLDLEVEVENLSDAAQSVAYTVEGANGLPIEGWWYPNKVGRGWGRYGLRDIVVHYDGAGPQQFACSEVVDDDVGQLGQGASMAYIGVDAQYFAAALLPAKASFADLRFRTAETLLATPKLFDRQGKDSADMIYNNPTFAVTTLAVELPAGARATDAYTLFAGPKQDDLLAAYYTADDSNYSLKGFAYYGWFAPIARLMLGILHFFYGIVGNYGLSIILLTMLVRGCMVPVSLKQAKNMAMMQKLKPEIDRIAAKYKDDRQKQARAQQELFAKHNYNPLGGCLPMVLQLPIFIGLYRALAVDVELRQAPLFTESIQFCSNLAAPDMLYDWSWVWPTWFNNGQGIFALGPFFNILPIASVALILVQQKLFMPPPTNEQMELQQKLMKYMMGFMAFLFFKMASGLCLYFIASGAWGIAERKLLPKPDAGDATPTPSGSSKKSPSNKTASKKSSPSNNGSTKSAAAKRKKAKKRR
ncbi:MAG: YidC/Oxa1 family insertase periplasmic-domain containing protein, partial [Planctomycetota bacterium]